MSESGSKTGLPAQLYGDAASPAIREIGATLGAAVHLALSPANFVIRSLQEALDFAERRIKEKFEKWKTPPEAIRQPPAEIAAPVVQALQYSGQDETLQEMYLTLLARSMDTRVTPTPHPAFAGILRQLSSEEARVLPLLPVKTRAIPLIEVRVIPEGRGWHTILKHVNLFGSRLDPPTVVATEVIDNYERLGILAIHEMHHLMSDELYTALEALPEVSAAKEEIERLGKTPSFHRYLGEVTDFGTAFLKSVLDPNNPPSDAA